MNPRVRVARAVSDTHVAVEFSNGETGVLDVSPYFVFPAFAELKSPAYFRRAHAAHGTVVWSDEIDLCPDTVWEDAVKM